MPRTRLDKYAKPKRDPLKGIIYERLRATDLTSGALAEKLYVSRKTLSTRLNSPTGTWRLDELVNTLHLLGADKVEMVVTIGVDKYGEPSREVVRL